MEANKDRSHLKCEKSLFGTKYKSEVTRLFLFANVITHVFLRKYRLLLIVILYFSLHVRKQVKIKRYFLKVQTF